VSAPPGEGWRTLPFTFDRVLEEARRLSPVQRAQLVAELLATLEPDVPSQRRSEREWIAELERRARAATPGSNDVPWTAASAQIRKRRPTQ